VVKIACKKLNAKRIRFTKNPKTKKRKRIMKKIALVILIILAGFLFSQNSFAYSTCSPLPMTADPVLPCTMSGHDYDSAYINRTSNTGSWVFYNFSENTVTKDYRYSGTYLAGYYGFKIDTTGHYQYSGLLNNCGSGDGSTCTIYQNTTKYYPSGTNVAYGGNPSEFYGQAGVVECTSWTYSDWGSCQEDGTQARTVLTSSPSGCSGGSPVLSRGCAYQLTVSPDPVTGGGVASSDDEIQCGVNQLNYCQTEYPLDSEIELTAYPNTDYAFAYWKWNGGASSSTNNPETFTMDGELDLTAVFKPLFTFPLYGYTPTTVPISAVMDHSVLDTTPVQFYQTDDIVRAFNGEIGDKQYGYSYTNGVWGYLMNLNEDEFLSGHTYTEGSYLFYDGHPGFDFAVSAGTDVLAPFDGKLYWATSDPVNGSPGTFGTFYIDHENGYTTWFLHCSGLVSAVATEVQQNGFAQVTKGDHIAESGNTGTTGYHLHFEVRKGGVDDENVIDPFQKELWE
jgi:hypothetical protein